MKQLASKWSQRRGISSRATFASHTNRSEDSTGLLRYIYITLYRSRRNAPFSPWSTQASIVTPC
uniref:Uncharacterized protein n=1 Tax=Anguilla anguilla TaxID=7936 RepID=A0A0E9RAL2_ANGAN